MKINFTDTLSVTFHTSDPLVIDHLGREFSLLNQGCASATNVDIFVVNSKKRFKKKCSCFNRFKASGRYYLLSAKNNDSIYIYLSKFPQPIDFFYCLMNPYRERRVVLSLIDFLHNVFLGILETKLLNENATIFHSCGYIDGKELVLIASSAQSGKTTAALHFKENKNVIAEDYCIVKNTEFYPLTIIKQAQYFYPHSVFEKINKAICGLTRKKQIKFETFSSAFGSCVIGSRNIDKMLFLSRDCRSFDAAQKMYCVMKNEIDNYVGFKKLVSVSRDKAGYEKLLTKLKWVLNEICTSNNIRTLCIPFKNDFKEYLEELDKELMRVQNGKK